LSGEYQQKIAAVGRGIDLAFNLAMEECKAPRTCFPVRGARPPTC